MFFILSKVLFFLISPLVWILIFLVTGMLLKNRNQGRKFLWGGLIILLIFTNPILDNEAWLAWEYKPVPLNQVKPHDAAILLTGFTSPGKSPHDRVYTTKGADRLLHTVLLYKKKLVRKIIVSGGNGLTREIHASEAEDSRRLLLLAGIPEQDIIMESKSRNTRENALFTKELLRSHPELKSFILVTSAFHMRRSTGCFRKVGIPHTVFAADFFSADRLFRIGEMVPSDSSLTKWGKLIHEITGYLVYWLMGYC